MPSLAKVIAARIKSTGESLSTAAPGAGLSLPSVRSVLAGKSFPNARSIEKYATFLGMDPDQVVALIKASKANSPRKAQSVARRSGRTSFSGVVAGVSGQGKTFSTGKLIARYLRRGRQPSARVTMVMLRRAAAQVARAENSLAKVRILFTRG